MLDRIRATVPDAAVSSDFIVGFPGETEASFEKSMQLVERGRFKNSFIFKYSPRQGTKADTLFIDDVPEEVKKRRNNDMLVLQTAISQEDNRRLIGQSLEVLVEGPSKSSKAPLLGEIGQLSGRSSCDRIVVFDGPERLVGQFVPVTIEDASGVTLFGRVVTMDLVALGREGERMVSPLNDLIGRWVASVGIDPKLVPASLKLESHFGHAPAPYRPGTELHQIQAWEQRHGYQLPEGLRAGSCSPTDSILKAR